MAKARKQKIALVYDAIYPYVKGGGEKRFYEFGKRLHANGYEVHLYGMKFWDGPKIIQKDGLYLHGLCKARPLYVASGRRSILQAVLFGVASLKMVWADFDVIDCCGFPYFSLFSCKLAAVIRRKKLVATWHEVWGKTYWKKYLGNAGIIGYWVEKTAARMPDSFVAVSSHTARALKKSLGVKRPIHIIENGIDTAAFTTVRPQRQKSHAIYVGRLMPFKHIDVFLHAVQLARQKMPSIKVEIIGDGPEKAALQALRERLKLHSAVTFRGFVQDHKDVMRAMKSSQVFVLPSSREGFGMVALEANAAGLPVITVNKKGNAARELIDGTNGVITTLDPQAIADALLELLRHRQPSDVYKQKAASYDWQHLTKKLEAVLA